MGKYQWDIFLTPQGVLKSHHMAACLPTGNGTSRSFFMYLWVSCSKTHLSSSQQWSRNFISVSYQLWKRPQATTSLHLGRGLIENPELVAPAAERKQHSAKCRNEEQFD